jgi:hypothetical protein
MEEMKFDRPKQGRYEEKVFVEIWLLVEGNG